MQLIADYGGRNRARRHDAVANQGVNTNSGILIGAALWAARNLQILNGWLPMHVAGDWWSRAATGEESDRLVADDLPAWKNGTVDVLRVLLETGGAEQLQVKNQNGLLPMHLAISFELDVDASMRAQPTMS